MSLAWTIAATFAATALLFAAIATLIHDLVFRYKRLVKNRLAEFAGAAQDENRGRLFKDNRRIDEQKASARTSLHFWFENYAEQSGIVLRLSTALFVTLGSATLSGIAVGAAFGRLWLGVIGAAVGLIAPLIYLRLRRRRRMRQLTLQLPEAFEVIGRAVRAGQTVPAALQLIADECESPVSDEFRKCYEEQNLGVSYETALRNLARRTGIMELRMFVVGLLIQMRCGGNLVDLLTNLSGMIRKRIKLEQKVKALTGEGRIQAAILIVLPIIAFGCITILSPEYIQSLIERPKLIAGTVGAQMLGALWIRHIIRFEY